MSKVLDVRDRLLRASLGFVTRRAAPRHLGATCVTAGVARQGFDLQLTRYDERGWRATFYTIGMEHSPTTAAARGLEAHAMARDAAIATLADSNGRRVVNPPCHRDPAYRS